MTLAILNLSGLDEAEWLPWFQAVLPDEGAWQLAADPDDLDAAGRALLIYDAPDAQFLRAMQAGLPFEQMMADWSAHAQQVLGRWRKARRRLFLIDADAFSAAPEALAESLGAWLGRIPGPPPAATWPRPDHPQAVLAAQAGHGLDPVRQLADELEIGGMSPRLARLGNTSWLKAAYATLQAQSAAADKADSLRKKLDKAKTKTRREAKYLTAKLDKARHAVDALTAKLAQATAETDALRAELTAEKDGTKARETDTAQIRHEVGALTGKLTKATAEAGDLRADLTAARDGAAAAAQAAQALFREETDLLQQQLVSVQQALEQEYRDGLAARAAAGTDQQQLRGDIERARRTADLEQLRLSTALTEQAQRIAILQDERKALIAGLNYSREEVDALLASTSWRVTAPLRRARLAVAKPT